MPPPTKLLPGPVGTSCLTCKRRHKKCDRQKPVCDRCTKGGFECLGYERNKSSQDIYQKTSESDLGKPGVKTGPLRPSTSPSHCDDSLRNDETPMNDPIDARSTGSNNEDLTPFSAARAHQDLSGFSAFYDEASVVYDTFPPTRFKTQVTDNGLSLALHSTNAIATQRPVFPTSPLLFELASRMPKSVSLPAEVHDIMEYVTSHFDRMFKVVYFKPQDEQIEQFQRESIRRMSTCGFTRQGLLIDARIHDSILEGSYAVYRSEYTLWIEGFEQAVRARLDEPLPLYELQERLNDVLEMFFSKGRLLDAATTYQSFCRAVPNFLQRIYSDPTLWPTQHDPTLVSIAHLLTLSRYGPACYALMDVKGAMIYGVPQLVDYNTDVELFHTEPHPAEWFDCFPGEFLVLLAKINACRDQKSTEKWQDIERQLISWEPRLKFEPKGLESWKLVAWRGLQESWRQTLLMYLYLAVCGVSTDDSRIRTSLRQVFQLMGVIRRQDPPAANVHFFSQCLVAGICSRTEKQRRLVRERLGCAAETRFWMFRGPEIVPVLDHLWLGAGVGGRPVTWKDYIHSRETMLPLSS